MDKGKAIKLMYKQIFLLMLYFVVPSVYFAQQNTFSRLYFPNSYGVNFTSDNTMSHSFIISNELEYRVKKYSDLFFRLSLENAKCSYKIAQHKTYNVSESELKINSFALGVGYRKISKKIAYTLQIQPGIWQYRFPQVIESNSGYEVTFLTNQILGIKSSIGIEYYFAETFGVYIESYLNILNNDVFYHDQPSLNTGCKIGITTTFF